MPAARLRPLAREDLFRLWTYIASDNMKAADAMVDRFDHAFTVLAVNPKIGQSRPDLGANVRTFVVGNYIVFYRATSDGIDVGRVMHGRRNIQPQDIWRGFRGLGDDR
jgi:toxin ParE1/3/4